LCTKQVVSARACAYQFLPYNSSRNCYPEMISRQTNARLISAQNDTLFYLCRGSGRGVGGHFGPEAQNLDMPVYVFFSSLLAQRTLNCEKVRKPKLLT